MKYTKEVLAEAVAASASIAGVLRYLRLPWAGGTHAHISRRIRAFGLDTWHFTGQAHNKGEQAFNRRHWSERLVVYPADAARVKPAQLRRALVESGVPYSCRECGLQGIWQDKKLILHVDHIDGNRYDCRPENLRFLCPNCHSQTPTWAGSNRGIRSYQNIQGTLSDGTTSSR
jgi:5-methylcytosine-specific restriction endonuclease McrA